MATSFPLSGTGAEGGVLRVEAGRLRKIREGARRVIPCPTGEDRLVREGTRCHLPQDEGGSVLLVRPESASRSANVVGVRPNVQP